MRIEEVVVEETYYERARTEDDVRDSVDCKNPREERGRLRPEDPEIEIREWHDDECWTGSDDWEPDYPESHDNDQYDECPPDADEVSLAEDARDCPRSDARYNKNLGMRGEDAAARYLCKLGYDILERNWKCPAGEADIIARDGDTIVFIEVKTRTGISKGFPAEAVNAEKRSRYEKIAAWYLSDCDDVDVPVRFDVVALLVVSSSRAFMKHYVNAFGMGC